jgi:tRNA dimethylallyltransferase
VNTHSAHYIVGPTASGKSDLAHAIARDRGWRVLSADSMNIYRGMDVGTAKPSGDMRSEVSYLGVDLATPDESFSVSAYIESLRDMLSNPEPLLVCGGTGLYLKALSEGLDSGPAPDGEKRREYEQRLESEGVESLQGELRSRSPQALDALEDPDNPRRLIRALERLDTGHPDAGNWGAGDPGLIAGIRVPREVLHQRIEARATRMFASGLLEEVQGLLDSGTSFSPTAAQAIGYREALGVLDGRLSRDEAVEQTALRTRQLVKKQLTWFRNKMEITWVDWDGQEAAGALAEKFTKLWAQHECEIIRF